MDGKWTALARRVTDRGRPTGLAYLTIATLLAAPLAIAPFVGPVPEDRGLEGGADAELSGRVTGAVRIAGAAEYAGTPPAAEPIDMSADEYCEGANTEPQVTRSVVVGEGGTLANVIVFIVGAPDGAAPPDQEVVLDQVGCRYAPHVFAMQSGQTLVIRNSDETLHNVHAHTAENRGFNIGQPIKGIESRRSFDSPEVPVIFRCDIHGWMEAYVAVFDHPFFAVTAKDGSFRLPDLPAGDYVIEAWHETLGSQTRQVTVTAGEESRIGFTFGS